VACTTTTYGIVYWTERKLTTISALVEMQLLEPKITFGLSISDISHSLPQAFMRTTREIEKTYCGTTGNSRFHDWLSSPLLSVMGDFRRCIESDPQSLRGGWERQLHLNFWRFHRDAEEIENANRYFREAERLRENAQGSQAVIVCREFLWQEMQKSRRGSKRKLAVFLMRCALMQILRIHSTNLDLVAMNGSRNSLTSDISFLDWIIRPELESEDTESLRTCRVIVCFELSFGHTDWE
jgi:hypothetical protein